MQTLLCKVITVKWTLGSRHWYEFYQTSRLLMFSKWINTVLLSYYQRTYLQNSDYMYNCTYVYAITKSVETVYTFWSHVCSSDERTNPSHRSADTSNKSASDLINIWMQNGLDLTISVFGSKFQNVNWRNHWEDSQKVYKHFFVWNSIFYWQYGNNIFYLNSWQNIWLFE